jgi:hypothetical protein
MDIYDGAPWTEMDIEDLKDAIAHGITVQDAAQFLCRSGTVEEVARKCRELTVAGDGIAIGSVADRCLLSGVIQTSHFKGVTTVFDPSRMLAQSRWDVDYPALPTRLSISLRSATKSRGFVSSPSAPPCRAFRLVTSSP